MQAQRVVICGPHTELERELRLQGSVVLVARNNEEALDLVERGRWDACILDASVFVSADLHLIRHARESDAGLALLFASSQALHSAESLEEMALLSGVDDFLMDHRARIAARKVTRAVARRRARGKHSLTDAGRDVLVVDWHQSQPAVVRGAIQRAKFTPTQAANAMSALAKLRLRDFGVLLCPPSIEGRDKFLVDAALRFDPRLKVVVVSGRPDHADTIDALTAGAFDYLLEPVGPQQAIRTVESAWAAYVNTSATGVVRPTSLRVLLVDVNASHRELIHQVIAAVTTLHLRSVATLRQAQAILMDEYFDAVLCCPESTPLVPLQVVQRLRVAAPNAALILLSQVAAPGWGALAMRLGAEDVLCKTTLGREALPERVLSAVQRFSLQRQRKALLHDVQLREASQEDVVRRSLDGMIVIDNRRFVVFANPAAERMFGKSSGEMLGSVVPIETEHEGPMEVELPAPNLLFAEITSVEVDWDGAKASLVTLRDVTERRNARRLRERLAHSDRLAAIGQMAAGVAHEINNPAAYVVANLVAMREHIDRLNASSALSADESESVEELANMVVENLHGMQRIQTISLDLKTFSRIDSQELVMVDVNSCVEAACRIALNEIRSRAQLVKRTGLLSRIPASPGKLAQVVTNLLINAAQAIPDGDTVGNQVVVSTVEDRGDIIITVEDTGTGIDETARDRLFDPFFTTKSQSQGTGLGLALCADIVRSHGGGITCGSSTLGGAQFEVRLPVQNDLKPSVFPPKEKHSAAAVGRPLRVLLIDDEPLVLRSLKRMLSRHTVITARGGREALDHLAHDRSFDLIVCDLMMPEMDGAMLHDQLAQLTPMMVEKLVFCSGGACTPRTKDFLVRSTRPLLPKPITVEDFEHVAVRVCGGAAE